MNRSPLWRARTESLTHLRRKRAAQIEVLEELFSLVDRCVDTYESSAGASAYARICGLTLLKAKNLAVGAYSLVLDGLGQEAGALLRPFIEYTELLTYFRCFPSKVDDAISNDLPSAGERAKAIDGFYKEFRQHLNVHASHSSYSIYSLGHLLESGTSRFKKLQHMVPHVLETNTRDLAVQLFLLVHEATLGLEPFSMSALREIGGECDDLKVRLIAEFELEKR